jgi:hypothetical protein
MLLAFMESEENTAKKKDQEEKIRRGERKRERKGKKNMKCVRFYNFSDSNSSLKMSLKISESRRGN